MFLVNSLPNICFTVNTLSQFIVNPHHFHWIVATNILRYIWGKIHYALRYATKKLRLHGYIIVNRASSVVEHKRTSRCCFSLGSTSIYWMSRKQKLVALSTMEAEYIAMSMACCEVIWLTNLFNELFEHVLDTIMIFCDNESIISLLENLVLHKRSKHININYHFIWDMVQ